MSFARSINREYTAFYKAIFLFSLPKWVASYKTRLSLLLVTVVVLMVYILQMSASSIKGYQIQQWENKTKELSLQQEQLNIEIANLGSMNNLEKRLAEISMVPASNIKYVSVKTDKLVAKK
jgi:Tfp pilus assembly protein PilO